MKLTKEQKDKSIGRLWDITEMCYTGAELPEFPFFKMCVDGGDVFVNVVEVDNRFASYALVNTDWNSDSPRPLLRSIAVLRWQRGFGHASRLLEEIANYYKTRDVKEIILHCKQNNVTAQRLYLKHGYLVTHVLRNYYAPEGDGLEMRKIL
jgi:GNAT superfamily N-acetyltransferase